MKRFFGYRPQNDKRGQAAMEVAIFGAIVIFIIGTIVRTGMSNAYTQSVNLKAMRYAMLQSWEGAKRQTAARNNASVIYIEDRLSADFGKYGSLDRMPFLAQGSGSFTYMMNYTIDDDELNQNLPLTDVFINGVHLTFTTANVVRSYPLLPPTGYLSSYTVSSLAGLPNPRGDGTYRYKGWDFACVAKPVTGTTQTTYYGCPLFYSIAPNGRPGFCATAPCEGLLTIDERFDLNRNDDFTDDPKDNTRSRVPRGQMAWQWTAIRALVVGKSDPVGIDPVQGSYPSFDVDQDRKEEIIYGKTIDANGVITSVKTLDFQEGDFDFSRDDTSNSVGTVGLMQDAAIYTRPRTKAPGFNYGEGTYFEIKEGKLYSPGSSKVVRSVSKKDQVDVIERRIRLSNDTGRMCDGQVPAVEICVNTASGCLAGGNIVKTCFDRNSKILYVRSRLLDAKGHKWITDASGELNLK